MKRSPVFIIILLGALLPVALFADSMESNSPLWQPVISVGSGVAIFSEVGYSTTFPIQNPQTDEFYNYFASRSTQTPAIVDGFLGAEWHGWSHFALQVGVNYNQETPLSAHGTLTQGADVQSQDSYNYSYRIITQQLLLEEKLLYTDWGCYHPYLLVGVGTAFNQADDYATSVPSTLTFTRAYQDGATTSFSYAVGMGMDVDLTSYLRFGIGYRFADLGRVTLGPAAIDGVPVSGTLSQSHLYANEAIAQLTAVF